MPIVLSHSSALAFWRSKHSILPSKRELKRLDDYPRCINYAGESAYSRFPEICVPKSNELQRFLSGEAANSELLAGIKQPWIFLVSEGGQRRRTAYCKSFSCEMTLPDESVFYLSDELAVCRPELCYLQVSNKLSLIRCIRLGYELCGYYSTDYSCEKGFSQHQPLTSKDACLDFLEKMPTREANRKLSQALAYVIDGSASPRESICSMLISLPCRLGGYGLEKPQLNPKVYLNEQAKRTFKRSYYTCDLYWPQHKVAVEYQSIDAHSQSRIADSDKRAALEASGIQVLELTPMQIKDAAQMDAFAKNLADALGGRRIRGCRIPDFEERKRALRSDLLKTSK